MNCFVHPDRPAVIPCPICGVGLCTDCAKTAIMQDNKPVCKNCAPSVISEAMTHANKILSQAKHEKRRALVSIIAGAIFMCAGVVVYFMAQSKGATTGVALFYGAICFAIAGMPTAILGFFDNASTGSVYVSSRGEVITSANNVLGCLGSIFSLAIKFVFSAIATPIKFIMSIFTFKGADAKIAKAKAEVDRINAIRW